MAHYCGMEESRCSYRQFIANLFLVAKPNSIPPFPTLCQSLLISCSSLGWGLGLIVETLSISLMKHLSSFCYYQTFFNHMLEGYNLQRSCSQAFCLWKNLSSWFHPSTTFFWFPQFCSSIWASNDLRSISLFHLRDKQPDLPVSPYSNHFLKLSLLRFFYSLPFLCYFPIGKTIDGQCRLINSLSALVAKGCPAPWQSKLIQPLKGKTSMAIVFLTLQQQEIKKLHTIKLDSGQQIWETMNTVVSHFIKSKTDTYWIRIYWFFSFSYVWLSNMCQTKM